MRFTTKVLPSVSGKLGIIELNHPKIFHSLSLEMVAAMNDILGEWHKSPLEAILLKASSSSSTKKPAFCAGGDVKSIWSSGRNDEGVHGQGHPGLYTADMFREEYVLNHKIATAPIPQVTLWDGIVMGGGVGISIHGKYRVATQNTLFAMPETAIGLFPDVGSMYWIPHMLDNALAQYVALTGARLKAADLLYTGLATHYIPSERLQELQVALVKATDALQEKSPTIQDVVAPVLMSFHEPIPTDDCFLAQNRLNIEAAFKEDTVEHIINKLKGMDNDFSIKTLETLANLSPTSLKVTMEGIKRGAAMQTIGEALQMEFRMVQTFMRPGSDFYEGIRAVLIDKDHSPQWKPKTLEEVTNDMVQTYFGSLGDNDLRIDSNSKL